MAGSDVLAVSYLATNESYTSKVQTVLLYYYFFFPVGLFLLPYVKAFLSFEIFWSVVMVIQKLMILFVGVFLWRQKLFFSFKSKALYAVRRNLYCLEYNRKLSPYLDIRYSLLQKSIFYYLCIFEIVFSDFKPLHSFEYYSFCICGVSTNILVLEDFKCVFLM